MQDIRLKDLTQRKVMYLICRGPWRQLPDMLVKLYEYVSKSGMETTGPPSGFYYNTPSEVGVHELSWEVFYPVKSETPEYFDDASGFGVRTIAGTRVAATIHKGSYRKAASSYERLQVWIKMQRLRVSGPAEEVYLTDISKANEEQQIEIRLPVCAV